MGCKPCPEHAVCGINCTIDSLQSQDDWWQAEDDPLSFFPCIDGVCRAGQCIAGYIGAVCAECEPSFGQTSFHRCEKCPASSQNWALVVGLLLGMCLACFTVGYLAVCETGESPSLVFAMLKVGLSAVQINSMLSQLDVPLPPGLGLLIRAQARVLSATTATVSLSCALLDIGVSPSHVYFVQTAFSFANVPLLLMLWLVCVQINKLVLLSKRTPGPAAAAAINTQSQRAIITGFVSIFFFLHPTLTLLTFQLLSCRSVDAARTDWRLNADLAARCFDKTHYLVMALMALPAFCMFVCAPVILAYLYLRKTASTHENLLLFLCSSYKDELWWWFLVDSCRKISISFLVAVFATVPLVQLAASNMVAVLFYGLYTDLKPIRSELHLVNLAEQVSLFVSISLLVTGSLIYATDDEYGVKSTAGFIMSSLLVMFYAGLVVLTILHYCKCPRPSSVSL